MTSRLFKRRLFSGDRTQVHAPNALVDDVFGVTPRWSPQLRRQLGHAAALLAQNTKIRLTT
jgi:hypothetical protein